MEQIKPSTLDGNGQRVLVVDDELYITQLIQVWLARHNFRVAVAHSGSAAVEIYLAQQADINLVITDIVMPDLQGNTVMLLLRLINPQVKLIAMSGYAPTSPEIAAIHEDKEHYLGKPFDQFALLDMVQTTLRDPLKRDQWGLPVAREPQKP